MYSSKKKQKGLASKHKTLDKIALFVLARLEATVLSAMFIYRLTKTPITLGMTAFTENDFLIAWLYNEADNLSCLNNVLNAFVL